MTSDQLNQIKGYCLQQMALSQDPQHDVNHVQRVVDNALKISQLLELNHKIDLHLLQAACYLHDIHYANIIPSFKNHLIEEKILQQKLPQILRKFNLSKSNKNTIIDAIIKSPHSFPFKKLNPQGSPYLKILQDADTLDYFSPQRLVSLEQSKKKFFFYRLASIISKPVINYGRRHLSEYLNYPKLASYFYPSHHHVYKRN